MPTWLFGLLAQRGFRVALAVVGVLGVLGVQSFRLAHAKAELSRERAQNVALRAAVGASEANRSLEQKSALQAVSDAEVSCQARVAAALKTGGKIRMIVEKPRDPPIDPKSGCPGRALVGSGELRDALGGP
ncbi:MAG TPA: hypothetical protein VJP88_11710 [Caulobacteraceae bacterium]|nr:hypothetical protein [Caulobacteraceae bacterium]